MTGPQMVEEFKKKIAQYEEGACFATEVLFSMVNLFAEHQDALAAEYDAQMARNDAAWAESERAR